VITCRFFLKKNGPKLPHCRAVATETAVSILALFPAKLPESALAVAKM